MIPRDMPGELGEIHEAWRLVVGDGKTVSVAEWVAPWYEEWQYQGIAELAVIPTGGFF